MSSKSSALDIEQKLQKQDPRYANGKIYCICSSATPKIYIGSTKGSLETRLRDHVISKKVCKSLEVIKCGNYDITRVCLFSCKNRTELEIEEGRWIREFRESGYEVVNERMPGMIAMAGSWTEYKKLYNVSHSEEVSDYNTKYKENEQKYTCECCSKTFNKADLKRHHKTKIYRNFIMNK